MTKTVSMPFSRTNFKKMKWIFMLHAMQEYSILPANYRAYKWFFFQKGNRTYVAASGMNEKTLTRWTFFLSLKFTFININGSIISAVFIWWSSYAYRGPPSLDIAYPVLNMALKGLGQVSREKVLLQWITI